jgi:hypothetical protein
MFGRWFTTVPSVAEQEASLPSLYAKVVDPYEVADCLKEEFVM